MNTLAQWFVKVGGDLEATKQKYPDMPWDTWECSVAPVTKAILLHNVKGWH